MIKSLRWRLQLWYAVLLLAVVAGFGSILYYRTYTNKLQEIDAQLEAGAIYLDAALRVFPSYELEGKDPPPPKEKKGPKFGPFEDGKEPPPWEKGKKGPRPGPPPLTPQARERLLAELALPRELAGPADLTETERPYFAVWRPDASVLKASALPEEAMLPNADDESFPLRPRTRERGDFREAWMMGPRNTRILVGRSVRRELRSLHAFAGQIALIGLVVLGIGLPGGYWLAARLFRPIAAMSAAASAIDANSLSTRLDTDVDIELAGLARVLNAMLDRLEAAFERQQQFTADASHELRTPLTILRANAELALSQSRSPEEYRQTIEACLRAADRMGGLVQGLLTLARADAGNPGLQLRPVLFEQLLADCLTALQPLAAAKQVTLTAELSPASVNADAESLTQLVNNMLTNAIQYNHAGGTVHVKLIAASGFAVLKVSNTGPGIPEQDRPHIFERFYRVDKARTRASGGAGLGLAICQAIVSAHGGTIEFDSCKNGATTFCVKLPLAG